MPGDQEALRDLAILMQRPVVANTRNVVINHWDFPTWPPSATGHWYKGHEETGDWIKYNPDGTAVNQRTGKGIVFDPRFPPHRR